MTREEMVKRRDELFHDIVTSCNAHVPMHDWSADDRMTLTMKHLQYTAIVTQLGQIDREERILRAIGRLDAASGYLLDAQAGGAGGAEAAKLARLRVTEALEFLES